MQFLLFLGIAVILSAWAYSNQAAMLMLLRASFQGEYKTADGACSADGYKYAVCGLSPCFDSAAEIVRLGIKSD